MISDWVHYRHITSFRMRMQLLTWNSVLEVGPRIKLRNSGLANRAAALEMSRRLAHPGNEDENETEAE
jgi:hypothetical protein